MSEPIAISIVIPTRNGMATLPAVLDAIERQAVNVAFEVVAVDSGSTDGTLDLLRAKVQRVISIAPGTFDHGLTRNAGVDAARGELIVLMVQDAVPATDRWLSTLTAPLIADPTLAGTFARQHPRPDASPLTKHYLARWVGASATPRTASLNGAAELQALDPMARLDRCAFDNVCSCIRRSVWSAHPFRSTPIGEDVEWAKDVLLAGYRLAYVPDAEVIHSHDRPARYELARTYILHFRLYQLFGLRTIPSVRHLLRSIGASLALHWRHQRDARALALAVAWPLGQYLGALTAAKGWTPVKLRAV